MAFNKAPGAVWPGYSSDGVKIGIPVTAVAGLTSLEAHPTAGDWRAVFFSLCSTIQTHYDGLASEDRSSAFIARSPSYRPSPFAPNAVKKTYSMKVEQTFTLEGPDVVPEP